MDLVRDSDDKQQSHVEIQPLLKSEESEEPSVLRDKKSECVQNTGEEIGNAAKTEDHITNTPVHGQLPLEHVIDGTNTSLENGSGVPDESNEKGTEDSGDKTEVKCLQTVNHSETAQANNMSDENTICTETKQVGESENKLESMKPGSTKQPVKAPSTTHTQWTGSHVLLIRGLAPAQSGDLKKLLNTTLGADSHRIEPRQRGDLVIRVRFRSKDDMDVARDILDKQIFMGCRLTARVENPRSQKRKAETVDEVGKTPPKKMKQGPVQLHVGRVAYVQQIARKTEDVYSKLQNLARRLCQMYPIYDGLIRRRELENAGVFCALNKFKICQPKKRFVNRCKFSIGTDAATGQLMVGLSAAGGAVKQVTSVPHNFPPHVVEAAKVFEKAIHACEQALEDPEGARQSQFWHELIIRTNTAGDMLVLVCVRCPEELAADKMTRVHKELKEFFENGEGQKCRVTSLYTGVTYATPASLEHRALVLGSPHLEETLMGLKLQLPPTVQFWSNFCSARMVSRGVEELLSLTKRISVVEVGFGLGLVGMHLSRYAGEVLSVVAHQSVAQAEKTAADNSLENVHYFGGNPVDALPKLAEKISCEKACAVVICSGGAATVDEIRKISKVRRLVLVTEMSKASVKSLTGLCNPSKEGGLGNPFFPVKATPVDTKPNEDGYVLMILMERIGLNNLPKALPSLQSGSMVPYNLGGPDIFGAGGHLMPLAIEGKGKGGRMTYSFQQGQREFPEWRNEFKQSQRDERRKSLRSFGGRGLEATASYRQHLLEQELMAQEWGRQMEEQHVGWTGDERQRRWPEKEQQRRQGDKGERRKWFQEKNPRRYMGEREFQRDMKEVELQKWVERERERELVGMNQNVRGRNALLQEVIADSLREAEISTLSAEASQKLKDLVAEAVRTVGVMDRGERHGIGTGSGVNRTIPEGTTDMRFGRSDTTLPQSRHFEDQYSQHMGEVDNPHDDNYGAYGVAVERSENKKKQQLRYFDEGYPQPLMEVDTQYQRAYNIYDRSVRRDGLQHDIDPQQSIYGVREGQVPRTGVDRAGPQPLSLNTPYGGSGNAASHLEGADSNIRHVYFSNSGNWEQKISDIPDTYTRHVNLAPPRTRNEDQPSHMGQSFHAGVEQNADRYVTVRAQNWNSSAVDPSYIPLPSPMKQLAGSVPKPPGTEDVRRLDGSSFAYTESAQRFSRFGVMPHHS